MHVIVLCAARRAGDPRCGAVALHGTRPNRGGRALSVLLLRHSAKMRGMVQASACEVGVGVPIYTSTKLYTTGLPLS